jgi:DNA-binding HxlR family transcriptional regulator
LEEDGNYRAMGDVTQVAMFDARLAILEVLPEEKEHAKTLEQILEDNPGMSRTTVQRVLEELSERSVIVRTGLGRRKQPYCWYRVKKVSAPIGKEVRAETDEEEALGEKKVSARTPAISGGKKNGTQKRLSARTPTLIRVERNLSQEGFRPNGFHIENREDHEEQTDERPLWTE